MRAGVIDREKNIVDPRRSKDISTHDRPRFPPGRIRTIIIIVELSNETRV